MLEHSFVRFSIYGFICSAILSFCMVLWSFIFRVEIKLAYVYLFAGMVLWFTIGFGVMGYFMTKPVTVVLDNSEISVKQVERKLEEIKFIKRIELDGSSVYQGSRFMDWFHGEIRVNTDDGTIRINGSKAIVLKYFGGRP